MLDYEYVNDIFSQVFRSQILWNWIFQTTELFIYKRSSLLLAVGLKTRKAKGEQLIA